MSAPDRPVGVLVMSYGSPRSADEVEAYYTHIRRGRPPTPEQLADLRRRYDAIGGVSPLSARTEAQRSAIAGALGERYTTALGNKHAAPFIEDGVAELARRGSARLVGLVLAPHYSALSVGEYHERARRAAGEHGLEYTGIDEWHLLDPYLELLARSVRSWVDQLGEGTKVVFTAHSLPERILAMGDPYPAQLRETAEAVAARAGLGPWTTWAVAWQSAGRTPEPWLGPDILEVVRELAETGTATGVVVAACGFVADHLEVLYDLDIEAARLAADLGLRFARTASVNDDPVVMRALAELVARVAVPA